MLNEKFDQSIDAQTDHIAKKKELVYDSVAELLDVCRAYQGQGNYAKALKILLTRDDAWGNSIPLLGVEAVCHRELNDLAKAEQCYKRILELSSEPPYWVNVGFANVLELKGNFVDCVTYMKAAIAQKYTVELVDRLMLLASKIDNSSEVYSHVASSIGNASGDEEHFANHLCSLGDMLLREGNEDAADEFFQLAIKKDPSNIEIYRKQLRSLEGVGNVVEAQRLLVVWQKKFPEISGLRELQVNEMQTVISDVNYGVTSLLPPTLFDPVYYRSQISKTMEMEPYEHYVKYGINKGVSPSPYFDSDWYCKNKIINKNNSCLLYTSPSPRDLSTSRMPSSA